MEFQRYSNQKVSSLDLRSSTCHDGGVLADILLIRQHPDLTILKRRKMQDGPRGLQSHSLAVREKTGKNPPLVKKYDF